MSLRQLGVVIVALCLVSACRPAVNFEAVEDAQTAARIKTALINDADIGPTTIEVSVVRGVARLSGRVPTPAAAARARTLTESVRGVRDVELDLQIVGEAAPASGSPPGQAQSDGSREASDDPRLLAVGASFGWSGPRAERLAARTSLGPLFRFGSGRGFGPAIALNWFQTMLDNGSPGANAGGSLIRVRPVMGGVSYTLASDRVSVSPSIVGGIAFNALTPPTAGAANRAAVEVANSLIWRPGVSVWFDVNRRAAVTLSAGYLMTRLNLTYVEDGEFVRRTMRGDTTLVQAGVAYKIF